MEMQSSRNIMANGQTHPHSTRSERLMPYACSTCARRKVKCDKAGPVCSSCRKSGIQCIYQPPAQSRAKRKATDDIQERLEQYQRILEQHGLLPPEDSQPQVGAARPESTPSASTSSAPAPAPATTPARRSTPTPSPFCDGGHDELPPPREPDVWTNIRDAWVLSTTGETKEISTDGYVRSTEPSMQAAAIASAALFGNCHLPAPSLIDFHPTEEHAQKLWEVYVRNVDPIVKFVHKPTAYGMLRQAARDPRAIADRTVECLLFAIYHVAVVTLSEAETLETFGRPWAELQDQYHNAVRIALISCQFYKTDHLAVLQAFQLLILSMRSRYDPNTLWALTGIGLRTAQRLQLDQDGEELGLKPFDAEMRRRLWWIIIPLDISAARLAGVRNETSMAPGGWTTKRPLNVNDEDLSPEMTVLPQERQGATEMIFCLARAEIGTFYQRIRTRFADWFHKGDQGGLEEFERALHGCKDALEEKFIRYCDITEPIHYFTVAMARAALDFGELQLRLRLRELHHHRQQDIELQPKRPLFLLAIKVLDHDVACFHNPAIARFGWFRADFFQWGPLIWILNQLCEPSSTPLKQADVEFAWEKIDQVYQCHPETMTQRRPIDRALAKLTLKAWNSSSAYAAQRSSSLLSSSSSPSSSLELPAYMRSLQKIFESHEGGAGGGEGWQWSGAESSENPSGTDTTRPHAAPNDFFSPDDSYSRHVHYPVSDFGDLASDPDWLYWEQLLRDSGLPVGDF